MTDQPVSPDAAPRQMDPLATEFRGGRFPLADLHRASMQAGGGAMLEGRTFTDCTIEGPAVMLVLENVSFDRTNFGPTGGDLRNILFRPMSGQRAIGAVPVRNCGIDPDEYQGFAFGMGVDRLAMLKYGIPDLRPMFEADTRWLAHYGFSAFAAPNPASGLS